MWLANQTRPGILNVVRAVARYSAAPKLLHWQAALHILMYIKSTSTYGITFQRGVSNGVQLDLYVDTDYAYKANDLRSVSGVLSCALVPVYRFALGRRNPLPFRPRRQSMW